MQDPQKLQEENQRLKAELEKITSVQKQKNSFLKKSILNITAPQTWKGVTVGIALSILVYEIATMDAAIFAVKSILAVGVILAIGFFGGQWAVKKTQIQAQKALNNTISTSNNTAANLISKLLQITTGKKITDKHSKELSVAINQYKPLLLSGGNWVVAFLFRLMAFSSLMGVLAIAVSFAIAIATFMQVELLEKQNEKLDKQNTLLEQQDSLLGNQNQLLFAQNKRLDQQTYLQEAERRSSLVFLFSNIMDAIDEELKEDYHKDNTRNLSPQLIGRIIALSSRLRAYRYLDGDTLIKKALSPERGQLLVSLAESQLDSITYNTIFKKADFSYADLKEANLEGAYLAGINLQKSNLSNANLVEVDLSRASLVEADLSNANLKEANLTKINLINSNLQEVKFWKSNLQEADLFGANIENGYWVGANLEDADLSSNSFAGVSLMDANLSRAHFVFSDLTDARTSSLSFIQDLDTMNITDAKTIQEQYYVDTTSLYCDCYRHSKSPFYIIKKK